MTHFAFVYKGKFWCVFILIFTHTIMQNVSFWMSRTHLRKLLVNMENLKAVGPNSTTVGKNEILIFTGARIKDYKNFKLIFDSIIGRRKIPPIEKILRLKKQVWGQNSIWITRCGASEDPERNLNAQRRKFLKSRNFRPNVLRSWKIMLLN